MIAQNGQASNRRVVLLGASNLTRGISTVVEIAQQIWGNGSLEVLSALGHGRSYGINSTVLGRTLPSILDCALWEALAARSDVPTAALVTDVGNDLLYQVEVPQIVAWVENAIQRLQQAGARVTMTQLPIGSLLKLAPRRYYMLRTVMFPRCRLTFAEASVRARELHDQLLALGQARGVKLIHQQADWYGIDPIHIRRRHWRNAWHEILSSWHDDQPQTSPSAQGSLRRWVYLTSRAPHQRWLLGIEQRRAQPAARLRDGTVVSFF